MAVKITDNFKIYFILLSILGLLLLFFDNQSLHIDPQKVITEISFPSQINICISDEK